MSAPAQRKNRNNKTRNIKTHKNAEQTAALNRTRRQAAMSRTMTCVVERSLAWLNGVRALQECGAHQAAPQDQDALFPRTSQPEAQKTKAPQTMPQKTKASKAQKTTARSISAGDKNASRMYKRWNRRVAALWLAMLRRSSNTFTCPEIACEAGLGCDRRDDSTHSRRRRDNNVRNRLRRMVEHGGLRRSGQGRAARFQVTTQGREEMTRVLAEKSLLHRGSLETPSACSSTGEKEEEEEEEEAEDCLSDGDYDEDTQVVKRMRRL